jgi:enoyl-CoA hydratase/carnithine racemase
MNEFRGKTLSWSVVDGTIELVLDRAPLNEIGSETLLELEKFTGALAHLQKSAHVLIISSGRSEGFCAGADLRELYRESQKLETPTRVAAVHNFLERIHGVMNDIDVAPITTIAAVQGICFGGGFELALVCDLIVADKTARFSFPELRLGLIPGFGGIPRLKRDLGNAMVRHLLLTGGTIRAERAAAAGLVSDLVGEGNALSVARRTAAQLRKIDSGTAAAAKAFVKPIPHDELRREIEIFCDLFARPEVSELLRRFVDNTGPMPYLPTSE